MDEEKKKTKISDANATTHHLPRVEGCPASSQAKDGQCP